MYNWKLRDWSLFGGVSILPWKAYCVAIDMTAITYAHVHHPLPTVLENVFISLGMSWS